MIRKYLAVLLEWLAWALEDLAEWVDEEGAVQEATRQYHSKYRMPLIDRVL